MSLACVFEDKLFGLVEKIFVMSFWLGQCFLQGGIWFASFKHLDILTMHISASLLESTDQFFLNCPSSIF